MPGPLKVEVGLTGAKVIVSELDIENDDGDGCCGRAVERVITVAVDECGGKDVALADDLKPREVMIGEVDDADVINVSVSVVEGKGDIQVENKGAGREMVDRSCTEFEVDAIDEVALIADGVAEVHRGINCVPFTPREKSKWFTQC